MEGKKPIQRHVTDAEIAANPYRQVFANNRNCAEQVNDYLRTPIRHLSPGEEVAEEGFRHQGQINQAAKNPQ